MSSSSTSGNDYFDDKVATFGDRIEAARLAEGLSADMLANRLGVSKKTLSNWENDEVSPRANRVQMMAGVLNVSLVWLMSGQGNGSDNVEQTYDRPEAVNEVLSEIKTLKQTLEHALARIGELEARLERSS